MKIDRNFYALSRPFTAQDTNFITGEGINTDLYPLQLPNKKLLLSSAEGIDSELFDQYKMAFEKMLQGDPNYFVCDIDCSFSLHPMMNGKPMKPLITQDEVDNAFATNPYKAEREYKNRFDRDGGEDVFVKRSTILKNSYSYYPVYANDGTYTFGIFWDPASKLDNSFVLIAEIIHDEVRGWMAKIVNGVNLIETLPNGDKMVIQKPEQIEIVKQMLLDYNR